LCHRAAGRYCRCLLKRCQNRHPEFVLSVDGKVHLKWIFEKKNRKIPTVKHIKQGLFLADYICSESFSNNATPIGGVSFVHDFFYLLCSQL
jgi:hypothetical protein